MNIWGINTHISHILSLWHQPCNKKYCTHICHVSLNKYACGIPNIPCTTNMLHVNLSFVHTYAKIQRTTTLNSHDIANYVPQKYAPQIGHICCIFQIWYTNTQEIYVHIYVYLWTHWQQPCNREHCIYETYCWINMAATFQI